MDILPLLDELTMIARNGLVFAVDPHDQARYYRLLELAAMYYGQTLDLPPPEVHRRFQAQLGRTTPRIGANAAIFDEAGRIVLMQRPDTHCWCLPGGLTDVIEAPIETAVREAREEVGLTVMATQLVDIYTELAGREHGPHALITLVYLCEYQAGSLHGSSESADVQYWHVEDVPQWSSIHQRFAVDAHALWRKQHAAG